MLESQILFVRQAGLTDVFYYGFHVLGFAGVILFNFWYGGKYGIEKRKTLEIALIGYPLTYLWMLVQYWIESGFTYFGGQNIVRSFIWIPLFALLAARVVRLDWARVCDFLAPSPCIVQCISHLGCVFAGCCHGYVSAHGIYNPNLRTTVFPAQPLESLVALLIGLYLIWRARRKGWKSDGTAFPVMLMLFGGTRFFLEFLRDNEKVLWGCSSLAFHALLMFLVGAAAYYALRRSMLAGPRGKRGRRHV